MARKVTNRVAESNGEEKGFQLADEDTKEAAHKDPEAAQKAHAALNQLYGLARKLSGPGIDADVHDAAKNAAMELHRFIADQAVTDAQ